MKRSPHIAGRRIFRHGMAAVLLLCAAAQGGCRAEAAWPLWDGYAQKFIDAQGRVIDHNGDDKTTTEGEAYAMFFALVADDRARFDKLLEWTEDNLAQGDLTARLPAWSWGKAADGSWKVLDANPAADADLWMAYALCEAGRLWDDPRYEKLGDLMAARVAQQEVVLVPGVGTTLIPGAQGFHPEPEILVHQPELSAAAAAGLLCEADAAGTVGRSVAESAAGGAQQWRVCDGLGECGADGGSRVRESGAAGKWCS